MQERRILVLGNDQKMYEVSDFVESGKNYADAIGIVFGSPIIGQRVLAFPSWREKWGDKEKVYTEPRSESKAVQVMSGLEDTKRIVEAQADTDDMTAAKRCWEYKAGGLQWYLPSLMELGIIYTLRDEINDAMEQLDCDNDCLLPTEDSDETWVWSSSELSQFNAWYLYFGNGNFITGTKCYPFVVRAVAAFQQPTSPSLLSGEAKSQDSEPTDEQLIAMLQQRGYKGQVNKTLNV